MRHKPGEYRFEADTFQIWYINSVMKLKLRTLEDTYIVCIVGSGIPSGQYLGSFDTVNYRVIGHKIVPDLDT